MEGNKRSNQLLLSRLGYEKRAKLCSFALCLVACLFFIQFLTGSYFYKASTHSISSDFLQRREQSMLHLRFAHGEKRSYAVAELERAYLDEINNKLICKLNALSWNTLTDDFHPVYTKHMKTLYHCIKRMILTASDLTEDSHFEFTLPRIPNKLNLSKDINKCFHKFIRLKMETIEKLLPLYPNMKIVHLVRDPRGIANSRGYIPSISLGSRKVDIQNICNTMWENLLHSKSILQRYPDSFNVAYFDEIAETPTKRVKETVEFTGLNFTAHMLKFVESKTSSAKTDDTCLMFLESTYSRKTAGNWRRELSFNFSHFVFETCKETNNLLGFLPFFSEALQLDLSIPS